MDFPYTYDLRYLHIVQLQLHHAHSGRGAARFYFGKLLRLVWTIRMTHLGSGSRTNTGHIDASSTVRYYLSNHAR